MEQNDTPIEPATPSHKRKHEPEMDATATTTEPITAPSNEADTNAAASSSFTSAPSSDAIDAERAAKRAKREERKAAIQQMGNTTQNNDRNGIDGSTNIRHAYAHTR